MPDKICFCEFDNLISVFSLFSSISLNIFLFINDKSLLY